MRERLIELGAALGLIIGGVTGWLAAAPPPGQVMDAPRIFFAAVSVVSFGIGVLLLVLVLTPTAGRRMVARGLMGFGSRIDPDAIPADRRNASVYREHIDTLLTWVYRRKHWGPGLSAGGKYHEGAPEFYGQAIYDVLGIRRKYKRRSKAMAEPDFDGTVAATAVVAQTQDVIGRMAAEGTRLLGEINDSRRARADDEEAEYMAKAQRWVDRCVDVMNWRLPHLTASFGSDAGRSAAAFVGVAWRHHVSTWMQVRLVRLQECVLNVDRFQGQLGPEPGWWASDAPDSITSREG